MPTHHGLDEGPYQCLLLAGLILVLPVAAWFGLRAATDERLDRLQEGLPLLVGIRGAGMAHLLGVLAYVADPAQLAWSQFPLPPWLRYSGALLGAAAWGLLGWTLSHLGRNLTDTVVVRREARLVTSGPYQFVRHPFYGAVALAMLATTLLTASAFLGVTGLTNLGLLRMRLPLEEQHLEARFGEAWRDYARRVPRLTFRWERAG